jgi:mono/diheme cytochrome c family protein
MLYSLNNVFKMNVHSFCLCALFLITSPAFAQEKWVAPESSKKIVNPYQDNGIATQKGQMLYSKLCWTCHGKKGLGDGPAGSQLNPKPKNFALSEIQQQSDGELFWKLSNGKGSMLPYKHSLGEEERWQLINYIRTLKKD